MCQAADELIKSMPPLARKDICTMIKGNQFRSAYNFEHKVRSHMGNGPEAMYLGDQLFDTIKGVRLYRERRKFDHTRTKMESYYYESANELRSAISVRRPHSTPDTVRGTSTKILDLNLSGGRYWSPKIQVSPAWSAMIKKMGGVSVSKYRIILSAQYAFRVDAGTTVYRGEILDVKERKCKLGWISRWQNGNEIELKFGDTAEGAVTRIRTLIMNNVMEEMRLV